ncbi:MAG: rhodanese-like domain-containing protein [Clostridiales bacterium]|nr:rhodanese-like domain-containing protein [Clostridiales bacterium]
MSYFDLFRSPDINRELKEFQSTAEAVLLDVRTPQEYREGHLPESKNIPLQTIGNAVNIIDRKETPIYVYCRSGSRSHQAAAALVRMGYTNVKNIGGITSYKGKVEY